ncbi:hypothetical protein BKA66DRAFT_210786 [Pyrenochaeta sp. MPI-SDFR-AT-0127]|nr:hypothetical protein BKA66DRAFT_210786 [Pyrenochaeta sp. MPI-SDFR-AT-0127]
MPTFRSERQYAAHQYYKNISWAPYTFTPRILFTFTAQICSFIDYYSRCTLNPSIRPANKMPLTRTQTVGIIVGILIILAITIGILIHRQRTLPQQKPSDEEASQQDPDPRDPDPRDPSPLGSDESRPPKDFCDWASTSNSQSNASGVAQEHARYPSLGNGPGPTINARPSQGLASSAALSKLRVERPSTTDSMRPSSLRQAVLDVGSTTAEALSAEKYDKPVEEHLEPQAKSRGYSGAWP